MNITREHRYGRFVISRHFIEDNPELVKRIMGDCIIVRAECNFATDYIEYVALSHWFDPVESGTIPPEYQITRVKQDKQIKWMFT